MTKRADKLQTSDNSKMNNDQGGTGHTAIKQSAAKIALNNSHSAGATTVCLQCILLQQIIKSRRRGQRARNTACTMECATTRTLQCSTSRAVHVLASFSCFLSQGKVAADHIFRPTVVGLSELPIGEKDLTCRFTFTGLQRLAGVPRRTFAAVKLKICKEHNKSKMRRKNRSLNQAEKTRSIALGRQSKHHVRTSGNTNFEKPKDNHQLKFKTEAPCDAKGAATCI